MLFAETLFDEKLGSLLGQLKANIKKNIQAVKDCQYSKTARTINYFRFSNSIRDIDIDAGSVYDMKNVYEADITAAYYATAARLGFMSDQIYNQCIALPKEERLRLLGAIATRKIEKDFDGYEQIGDTRIKVDEDLREAWFKICAYVDAALQYLQDYLGQNFLFYWVDGIYYKDEFGAYAGNAFINYMNKAGFIFDWKITKLNSFELKNKGYIEIVVNKNNREGIPEETFFYPKREIIKSYKIIDYKDLAKSDL